MHRFQLLVSSILVAILFGFPAIAADASSIDPIIISGKHFFFKSSGDEFFIKGIAYQQNYNVNSSASSNAGYTDPLADIQACQRDIPYLTELSTNVIRTYAIDPTKNHDACMNAFAQAGIYVISDLSEPTLSINSNQPSWDNDLYNRYTQVIDDMQKYQNVIGFFAGNEVTSSPNTTAASAYVKAAVRDMKAYIKTKGYRQIYIGYATYDAPAALLTEIADYYNCGNNQADAVDFLGYNIYSWCGTQATYQSSHYQEHTDAFMNYSVPAFFAEYGCNQVQPRKFTEVAALYGDQMTPVWSGGIVYMYFQTENNYGLVSVSGTSVSTLVDFPYLSQELKTNIPKSTPLSDYTAASLAPQACPTVGSTWAAADSPLPPTPNSELCSCLISALYCVVKPSTLETSYGNIFSYVCGKAPSDCQGILSNSTTGQYGPFSVCNSTQQLSYAMDEWYISHGGGAGNCDFNGAAQTQAFTKPSGTCASLLSAASASGSGTGSPAATSSGAAVGLAKPGGGFGMGPIAVCVVVAAFTVVGVALM